MEQARAAEADGPDKAVEAWRGVIARDPRKSAPWRELARVLRQGEKWRPLADVLKEEEQAVQRRAAKVEALRELADLYREQLRNEQQVMTTLARIVEVDPKRLEVYDELAANYESKKRWPDLVATLTRKAENLPDPVDQVALYLQIANLYIERFSNQAEAIKAFERVLELDSHNEPAINHLLDGLREAPRLGEADRSAREARSSASKIPWIAPRRPTRSPRSRPRGSRSPRSASYWWEKVLSRAEPRRGPGRALRSSTSATRAGTSWPRSARSRRTSRPTTRPRPMRCRSSACSTPRRSRTTPRRSTRGAPARARRQEPPRPGRAQEALRHQQGRWDDARGLLPLAAARSRSTSACSSARSRPATRKIACPWP